MVVREDGYSLRWFARRRQRFCPDHRPAHSFICKGDESSGKCERVVVRNADVRFDGRSNLK
jgi:hypothetical protein